METTKRTFKPPIAIAILEKSSTNVSYCWKACQIFSYVIVWISGIATCLAMGNISKMAEGNCILYSNLTVVANHSEIFIPVDWYHEFNPFGAKEICDFCQYSPVASAVFAGIWTTFFFMCGRGGKSSRGLYQPWRIVPPAMLFNLVFIVISVVAVVMTFQGFSSFCAGVQRSLNISSCDELMDYGWKIPHTQETIYFYDDLIIAEIGSVITLAGWVMGFLILSIRCLTHADFTILSRASSRDDGDTRVSVQSDNQSTGSSSARVSSMQSSQASTPEKPSRNLEVEPLIVVTSS